MSVPDELRSRFDVALDAAWKAADLTLDYFQTDQFQVERKGDDSPVTIADRQAEQQLRERIGKEFPNDAILGEEFGETSGSSGYRWIFDPIDGTKSFISGVPLYGTLVGVEFDGRSRIGVIVIPGLQEAVFAVEGGGAFHQRRGQDPQPTQVRPAGKLSDGTFVTSQVDSFDKIGRAAVFQALQSRAYVTRTWGDAYGYLLVATGRAAVMVDPGMCLWDAAPMQPILEEAGGVFVDWDGQPSIYTGNGIACHPDLLPEVLECLQSGES